MQRTQNGLHAQILLCDKTRRDVVWQAFARCVEVGPAREIACVVSNGHWQAYELTFSTKCSPAHPRPTLDLQRASMPAQVICASYLEGVLDQYQSIQYLWKLRLSRRCTSPRRGVQISSPDDVLQSRCSLTRPS